MKILIHLFACVDFYVSANLKFVVDVNVSTSPASLKSSGSEKRRSDSQKDRSSSMIERHRAAHQSIRSRQTLVQAESILEEV